jgi:type 1 glutamine amidotransferase
VTTGSFAVLMSVGAKAMTRHGKRNCLFILIWIVLTTASIVAGAEKQQAIYVLLVTGIDHPAHKWQQTAPALAEVLQKDPRLRVRVVEDPHFLDSSALSRYSVVVLHFMSWEQPTPGEEARANLRKFVQSGKGLFILHFGCGAFRDWPEFRNLAGRVWDPDKRAHDPYGKFRVNIINADHPITRGMQSFETEDELYTCLAGDRPIGLLATARSKVDGKDYPMAFVFDYGKGRVFHTALGHDVKAIRNPSAAELFRRGCAWTARLTPIPGPQKQKAIKK